MTGKTYYSMADAAELLDVTERTVRRQIASGQLRAIRFGRTIRIHRDDLQSALKPITYLYA